jgi:cytochrome P450
MTTMGNFTASNEPIYGLCEHVPLELVRRGPTPGLGEDSCPYQQFAAMHEEPRVQFLQPDFMRPGGSWTISRGEDVRYVLQHPELFSSEGIAGFSMLLGQSWKLIPLELDPPEHTKYRTILNGIFSPAKIKLLEDGVRSRAVSLIDAVVAKGECEFIEAFARPFPVTIFMQIMGLPDEDFDELVGCEHDLLHSGTMDERIKGARGFYDYLVKLIASAALNRATTSPAS